MGREALRCIAAGSRAVALLHRPPHPDAAGCTLSDAIHPPPVEPPPPLRTRRCGSLTAGVWTCLPCWPCWRRKWAGTRSRRASTAAASLPRSTALHCPQVWPGVRGGKGRAGGSAAHRAWWCVAWQGGLCTHRPLMWRRIHPVPAGRLTAAALCQTVATLQPEGAEWAGQGGLAGGLP